MSPIAPTDSQLSGFIKYLIQEGLLTENEATNHNLEAQKKHTLTQLSGSK